MIRYASVDADIARSPVRKAVAMAILEEVIILSFGFEECFDIMFTQMQCFIGVSR